MHEFYFYEALRLLFELIGIALFTGAIQVQPCCCGGCACCQSDTDSQTYQVEFSGVANNTCTECDLFNATFEVRRNPGGAIDAGSGATGNCLWGVFLDDEPCAGAYGIGFGFQCTAGVKVAQVIVFEEFPPGFVRNEAGWGLTQASSPFDCSSFAFDHDDAVITASLHLCDWTGASGLVSAL